MAGRAEQDAAVGDGLLQGRQLVQAAVREGQGDLAALDHATAHAGHDLEAQRGVMETQIAKINQEIQMAKAFGPDVAGAERAKRQGITEQTQSAVGAAGSGQMAFSESMKQSGQTLFDKMIDGVIMTFTDPAKKFSTAGISDTLSNFGLGLGTSGQEATKGMSDNPRRDEEVLRQIHRTLKGGS